MKDFEYYETKTDIPDPRKIHEEVFGNYGVYEDSQDKRKKLELKERETMALQMKLYRAGVVQKEVEFKADAFKSLDIENNPKRFRLYQIAYDFGHSEGYHEIFNFMEDMVELIK
jgi:hypothetical protein